MEASGAPRPGTDRYAAAPVGLSYSHGVLPRLFGAARTGPGPTGCRLARIVDAPHAAATASRWDRAGIDDLRAASRRGRRRPVPTGDSDARHVCSVRRERRRSRRGAVVAMDTAGAAYDVRYGAAAWLPGCGRHSPAPPGGPSSTVAAAI